MPKPCGASVAYPVSGSPNIQKSPRRNGMDNEPEVLGDVRSWQMSPFNAERFDLDEIQRAEKRGIKGRFELERLLVLYGKKAPEPVVREKSPCPDCAKRERDSSRARRSVCKEYVYQPYGPNVVPTISFNKPKSYKPRVYGVLGPSPYVNYIRRADWESFDSPVVKVPLRKCPSYTPLGPSEEIRLKASMYVPMGPHLVTELVSRPEHRARIEKKLDGQRKESRKEE